MDIPFSRSKARATGCRWQAVDKHILGSSLGRLLEGLGQTSLSLLLSSDKGLLACLTDELDLGLGRASDAQKSHHVALVHDAQSRVVSAVVALPVRISGDVTCGEGYGVVVGGRVVGAGGRVAVVGVEGNAIGTVRVDGEDLAENLPDSGGLDGVFLRREGNEASC